MSFPTKQNSSDSSSKPIVIVGAGLTGCCIAILLSKRFPSEQIIVLEGRDDYRKELSLQQAASKRMAASKIHQLASELQASSLASEGSKNDPIITSFTSSKRPFGQFDNAASRSINLALSHRGICGLQRAGLWDEVQSRQMLILMKGRMIHKPDASLQVQPYGQGHEGIYSVSRLALNCMFLDRLDSISSIEVRFLNKLVKCNKNAILSVRDLSDFRRNNGPDGALYEIEAKFVLGCDGAFSATRAAMQRLGRYDFGMQYIPHGYKEFTIHPNYPTHAVEQFVRNKMEMRKNGLKNASETNLNNKNDKNNQNDEKNDVSLRKNDSKTKGAHDSDFEENKKKENVHANGLDTEETEELDGFEVESEFSMPENYLHIWPRHEFMMIGLPNPDKTFTCTLFAPWDGANGLEALEAKGREYRESYFKKNFGDFVELCSDFSNYWETNPSSPLAHIHIKPWNFKNKILLLGDAAHAIVPFYGQGMNSGFEDCVILDEMFEKHLSLMQKIQGTQGSNGLEEIVGAVFKEFSETRRPSCEALSELSLQNYVEMRSLTGKKWFLYKKKLEVALNVVVPSLWRPIYSMVSFSRTPYHEAKERALRQDKYLGIGMGLLTTACVVASGLLAKKYVDQLDAQAADVKRKGGKV